MAAVGTNELKTMQYLAEEFNKKNLSGVKSEVIGIDNKLSPQETSSAVACRSASYRPVEIAVACAIETGEKRLSGRRAYGHSLSIWGRKGL